MSRMNWDRVNRENRAISEANRVLDPEPTRAARSDRPKSRMPKSRKRQSGKRKRMTEKERALAWHRQNRTETLAIMTATTSQHALTRTR